MAPANSSNPSSKMFATCRTIPNGLQLDKDTFSSYLLDTGGTIQREDKSHGFQTDGRHMNAPAPENLTQSVLLCLWPNV